MHARTCSRKVADLRRPARGDAEEDGIVFLRGELERGKPKEPSILGDTVENRHSA
jgi:hypothetical protein